MTAKKSPLLKCPTTEHILRVLAELSEYVASLDNPGFLRVERDGEEAELLRKLCVVLRALESCAVFWDRLWAEGPHAARQLLDLGRVDATLSEIALEQLAFVFHRATDMDIDIARQLLESRMAEIRSLYVLLDLPAAQPSTVLAATNKAHEAVRKMKDEICARHMKNAQAEEGANVADKFRRALRGLGGVFFASLANAEPLLEFETGLRVELHSEDRDILLALSVVALLSMSIKGEPMMEMEVT